MIEKTYIWCKNYSEFSELMKILHSKGYKWASGKSTLEWEPYPKINRDNNRGTEIEISASYTIRYGFNRFRSENNSISFTAFMIKEGIKVDKFTKADLEDGMIMKTRDDRYYMYFKKLDKGVRYEGCITLKEYNDDLIYSSPFGSYYKGNDIVAVYSPENLTSLDFKSEVECLKLIWERPEEVVMTISEIEEKLGIKNLKVVSEKENDNG